jgi:SAM-dependent methyltransferase
VPLAAGEASTVRCDRCDTAFPVEDGIVALSPPTDDRDYPEALVDLVAEVEARHFWFAARNAVIVSSLRAQIASLAGKRALDVGCGTGFTLSALEAAGLQVCGVDMHAAALRYARARLRGPLVRSDATVLPFPPDFDIVSLFDVIEHTDDDVEVLRQAQGALRPDGQIVVTVPAGPELWTQYDEVIGHKRRYTKESLGAAIVRSGLQVRSIEYFNCLPSVVQAVLRRKSPAVATDTPDTIEIVRRALRVPPEPINRLLALSVRAEAPFRRFSWLRGGSLIAIAARTPGG